VCAFTKQSNATYSYLDGKETNAVTVQKRDVHFEICCGICGPFINCIPSIRLRRTANVEGWVLHFGEPLHAGWETSGRVENLVT